jgi:hypothetical protein
MDDAMRASDADRAAVADRLRTAVDEGRLTVTEYDERLRLAYAAVTYGDLKPLTADLPAAVASVPATPPVPVRHWLAPWGAWLGGNLFFVALWAWGSIATGHLIFFWPFFFMFFSAAGLGRRMLGGGGR